MTNVTFIAPNTQKLQKRIENPSTLKRVREGVKNSFGVWDPWQDMAYDVMALALDPVSENNQKMWFASTWEGAAAQASSVFVHDIPELSALGPCITDGHALLVSRDEMERRLLNQSQLRNWLREGAGLCAALALPQLAPAQHPVSWTAISPDQVTSILATQPQSTRLLECYSPNPSQDAWRYASAITFLCQPNDTWFEQASSVPDIELNSSWANHDWKESLLPIMELQNSFVWRHREFKNPTTDDLYRFLTLIQKNDLPSFMETRLMSHVLAWNPDIPQEQRIEVAKKCASDKNITRQQIANLVDALSGYSLNPNQRLRSQFDHALFDVFRQYYALSNTLSPTPTARLMTWVSYLEKVSGDEKQDVIKIIVRDAAHCGPYTHQELGLIAQKVPAAIQAAIRATPNVGPVIVTDPLTGNASDLFGVAVNYMHHIDDVDSGFTSSSYVNMLVDLLHSNQASISVNPDPDDVFGAWDMLKLRMDASSKDHINNWKKIVSAAQSQNPQFATQLLGCWSLCHSCAPAPYMLETLIDQGADLLANHPYNDIPPESIASFLLGWCQTPSIRLKAQRVLKEKQDQDRLNNSSVSSDPSEDTSNVVSLCRLKN